ncbi:MAG: RraA family protein [Bryobacterales bacterium]|nr:RraA family protein [Bryobacterales bacterium]MDE0623331.1 RraA family protein [Bryobacterales bacterium]
MALPWRTDGELFELVSKELFSAVVGDVMDEIGLVHQFLPPEIRPLDPSWRLVGRAMPVWVEDLDDDARGGESPSPFGRMLEALDDLRDGEVYVCGGGSPDYALWGELMTTRAQVLGATGAVLDGYYRDTDGIASLGFPTFGYGSYAQDQRLRGHVVDFRVPIRIGQVLIEPGDIVIGDRDGVCVAPRRHESAIFVKALEKVRAEKVVQREIEAGMPSQEAFAKYGVM